MSESNMPNSERAPKITTQSFLIALVPLLFLILFLAFNIYVFGDDSLSGANQIALISAAGLTIFLPYYDKVSWEVTHEKILDNIKAAMPANLILLLVGALSGVWLLSGIIPTIIFYGLNLFSPTYFLVSACIITAITSVIIGSSWSTSATLGVALVGIGQSLGINPGLVAGAVISGAYFGDKLSPFSDTTNLASGVTNVDLFEHIRYLSLTTVPSFVISLILYLFIGFTLDSVVEETRTQEMQQIISSTFNVSPFLMLVPALTIGLIAKKMPALPALFIGVLLGIAGALIFQSDLINSLANQDLEFGTYQVIMKTVYSELSIVTGDAALDELLSTNGMYGMLNTIWLIISAMVFGGAMQASGYLSIITEAIVSKVKSAAGLVSTTIAACLFTNVSASDQYLSIVLPGRMFSDIYKKRNISLKNLSRSIEDGGTVTGVLIPWNTCGAFHASVLGVATFAYLPWTFFCLISPVMSIVFAVFQIKWAQPDTATATATVEAN